jgi:hypothetical protein
MISSDNIVVMQADWDDQIKNAWAYGGFDYRNQEFLDTIWEMSLTAFDIGREVQVVIDGKMNIYISAGDPGFVWFKEPPKGMCLPIECWIHTHPFGSAYFSGTDWTTIKTWEPVMNCAIVLGDKQQMDWVKGEEYTVFYQQHDIPDWANTQMTLDDFVEEE